ncbi:hypothetical protein ABLM60_004473 [Shigella flexneri]|uniref:DUF7659 family protein n=1 Tax=Bacteria TaxID=2 RepID=UPI00138E1F97|nr:hypothetical protein [Pseudoalteromonas undina]HEO0885895.1 hypothetical protein [Streptococcus agalactiae]
MEKTIAEMKERHREEINNLPMAFAFNNKQLQKGLEKLSASKDEVVGIGAGGFMKKEDVHLLNDTLLRHEKELKLLKNN